MAVPTFGNLTNTSSISYRTTLSSLKIGLQDRPPSLGYIACYMYLLANDRPNLKVKQIAKT